MTDEELKLKSTIELINNEIEALKNKRTDIINNMRELSKNELEEFRSNPEDPFIINPYNHQFYLNEDLLKQTTKKLKELNIMKNEPYFGRIDYDDLLFDEYESIYIGRFSFYTESDEKPIVIDWRSPVASLFYEDKIGELSYNAPSGKIPVNVRLKRQYIIKKGVLQNMFDTDINVDDDMLQLVLGKNADDRMKDIVKTIQKEQNIVIRENVEKDMIIQGVAGSGKTSIALHRVAYLLYTYRDKLKGNEVLILGPNELFLDYISNVLPSLGEENIRQTTFNRFAKWLLNIDLGIVKLKDQYESILNNEKHRQAIMDIARFKGSLQFKEIIDKYLKHLQEHFFEFEDIKYLSATIISKDELTDMFYISFEYMPIERRIERLRVVIKERIKDAFTSIGKSIIEEYKMEANRLDKNDVYYDYNLIMVKEKYREVIKMIKNDYKMLINDVESMWSYDLISLYKRLFNKDIFSKFYNGSDDLKVSIINYSKSNLDNNKLDYDDLAPIIYMGIKLNDINLSSEIKHIVIDEAQDFSPFQILVIKLLIKDNTMTVLGDISQAIYSYRSIQDWQEVREILGTENIDYYNLKKSYRSTEEIMTFANQIMPNEIMPMLRQGEKPTIIKANNFQTTIDSFIEVITKAQKNGYNSIAIIGKTYDECMKIYSHISKKINIRLIVDDDVDYSGNTIIIPSYLSKGLEFDVVIIPDVSKNNYTDDDINRKLLYTIVTRTLHKIYLYYTDSLSQIIINIDKEFYNCKTI